MTRLEFSGKVADARRSRVARNGILLVVAQHNLSKPCSDLGRTMMLPALTLGLHARITEVISKVRSGVPDPKHISTSYVKRRNLTMRMQLRRLTRLTNGFSRKLDNLKAAIALHFAYYNFCRVHSSLRLTPAMERANRSHLVDC